MSFPIPSAKLFTSEEHAISGKVDNKANAVVNLTINPSEEKLVDYKKDEYIRWVETRGNLEII